MYNLDIIIYKTYEGAFMDEFLSIGTLSEPCRYSRPHCHDIWELVYYTEGKGINRIGEQDIPFEKGCFICQPPGISHSETSEEGFKNIFLLVKTMDDFDMDISVFYDSDLGEIKQLFTQMLFCYHLRPYNWNNILKSTLALLNEYMVSRRSERRKNRYVELCEKIIAENISNCGFSLSEALRNIPMAGTYFMKLFKKETGHTPHSYLQKKRLERARQLMASVNPNSLRIKDIARMSGFDDQYYFSRVFKTHTGVTPKLYFSDRRYSESND